MSEETVIALEGVRFAYGREPVLQDIDLHVQRGRICGLVGADGAGKSTLLRIALGQLVPHGGAVRVLGRSPVEPGLRDELAYMPQGGGLYEDLSVEENLRFFSDLHGLGPAEADARIRDLLERTGLAGFESRRAGQLSGGMMQKLALACALVTHPQVMFLDEPTTGVDPVSRRAFWRLLDGVRTEGVAILYATANMDEAERCDAVAVLEEGRIRRSGTPREMIAREGLVLFGLEGPNIRARREALRKLPGVVLAFPVGERLNVWLQAERQDAFRQQVATDFPDLSGEPQEPGLHDAALRDLALSEDGDG
jgi:ABC-2 type transport system ATP-binding protein